MDKNLLKASRINRILPVITLSLIPFAITNYQLKDYFIFIISLALLYSAVSILNAIKDNDYKLNKNAKNISYIIILISLVISTLNKYSFIYITSSIILGFIYNNLSRKIILGDSIIAGFTHFSLPILFTGLITNLNMNKLIPLTIIVFFLAPSIAPTTNIKDIKEDKKRKYKTLINSVKNPQRTITISLIISYIIILVIGIQNNTIIPLLIFIPLLIKIKVLIKNKKFLHALIGLRIYLTYAYLTIIFFTTTKIEIIITASIIHLINIMYSFMMNKKIQNQ